MTILVLDGNAAVFLGLGTLPDLNLHTATNDTNTHCAEKVVCGVGVIVHTAIEHTRSVLANTTGNQCLATRVIGNETRNIVNDTGNGNKSTPIFVGLFLEVIPFHHWELFERKAPVKLRTCLIQLL